MIDDNLTWLLKWYHQYINDRKSGHGIEIRTLDNPGWFLRVDLEKTELQDKPFKKIRIDRSEHNWIRCYIKDGVFEGAGGPLNMPEILQTIRDWVENIK
jgi:hypothetical protein